MSVHTREFVIFPFFSPTLAGSSVTKRKTHGLAPLICDIMPCTVASPPPPFVIIIFCLFEASYRTYGSIGKKNISPHRQKHFKIETKKKWFRLWFLIMIFRIPSAAITRSHCAQLFFIQFVYTKNIIAVTRIHYDDDDSDGVSHFSLCTRHCVRAFCSTFL